MGKEISRNGNIGGISKISWSVSLIHCSGVKFHDKLYHFASEETLIDSVLCVPYPLVRSFIFTSH